jgi:hypothetical protein
MRRFAPGGGVEAMLCGSNASGFVAINALLVIEAPQAVKGKKAGRAPPALSPITSSKH